jgi:hypothetical protein
VKKLLAIVILCTHVQILYAQNAEKIEPDRPGRSQTPFVVPKGKLQVETGFEWKKEDDDQHEIQHPELVIKYGILKHLEIRTRLLSVTDKFKQTSTTQSGLEPIEVGVKALITEAKGIVPHSSFSAQIGLPRAASKNYTANKVFPKLRLNLENELSEKLYLEYNVGAEWDGENNNPQWLVSVSPHLEIGEKFQIFAETFTDMQVAEAPEVSVDAGLLYYLTKNFALDLAGGLGVSKKAPKSFVDLGFSFRF